MALTKLSTGILADSAVTTAKLASNANAPTATKFASAPAFSVTPNAVQSVTLNTWTKIALQLEEYDTSNAFDAVTNFRFTPNVAGYYAITGCVSFTTSSTIASYIYKNGAQYRFGSYVTGYSSNVSAVIYLNGTTDYVELYGFTGATQNATVSSYFNGVLVKPA